MPIRVRNCGCRSVLREKRSTKPHTILPVRSVQRTGNQRVAVHHGRSVPHQHEVRPYNILSIYYTNDTWYYITHNTLQEDYYVSHYRHIDITIIIKNNVLMY